MANPDTTESVIHPLLYKWHKQLQEDLRRRPQSPFHLPVQHAFAHDYCHLLNDSLGALLRYGDEEQTFSVRISHQGLTAHALEALNTAQGEALVHWMEANGFGAEVRDMTERQVIAALLADANASFFEALGASAKGKLTIAYALIRKPLRENLMLLEYLLADRDGFLATLDNDNAELELRTIRKESKALPIIREAVRRISVPETFEPSFLFDLRYAEHKHYSLAPVLDKATHLVTGNKHFATEASNLNFVFSGAAARESQWNDFYRKLPYLLLYYTEIAQALMRRIAPELEIGEQLLSKQRLGLTLSETLRMPAHEADAWVKAQLSLPCPLCGSLVLDSIASLEEKYLHSRVTCRTCGISIQLPDPKNTFAVRLRVWTWPVRRYFRSLTQRANP
jgi:hypothetical protein